MLPCRVIVQFTPPTFRARHSALSRSCNTAKDTILSFQSLTHSSQFTNRSIPSIFFALRTLCQKHRGVGSTSPTEFFANRLTPTGSISFTDVPSNSFRILLFQTMYPPTPLESNCFTNAGRNKSPKIFRAARSSPRTRHELQVTVHGSQATASGSQATAHRPRLTVAGDGSSKSFHRPADGARTRHNSCPAAQGLLSWALFGFLLRPRRSGAVESGLQI